MLKAKGYTFSIKYPPYTYILIVSRHANLLFTFGLKFKLLK